MWECDPFGSKPAVVHPAMGVFSHEAVAVDPADQRLYLTEDHSSGGFYRYTPARYPDLSNGLLEVAIVGSGGVVRWRAVRDPSAASVPTREQVAGMTRFRRGEGIWFDSGIVYVATTSDSKIHAYNTGTETIEVIYDGGSLSGTPLLEVDNITVSPSGDLFVCEDAGDLSMGIITPQREVANFLKLTGPQHGDPSSPPASELTGVVFDPSGRRLFFSSQRAFGTGVIYEITGPYRLERIAEPTPPGLRIDVQRSITIPMLLKRGLPVSVRLGRPAAVGASARVALAVRRRRAHGRGFVRRRQRISLGVADRDARLGAMELRLRPTPRARSILRARRTPLTATVRVSAVDRAGKRSVVTRSVVVRPALRQA